MVGGITQARADRTTINSVALLSKIRAELVAVRAMTSMAVIVAVLTRHQPGGPSERAHVLAFLVSPESPTSIENGLTTCRRWLRQLQRAKELNLMLPDATLLIKGADSLMGPVLTRSQQSVFRLNSYRNERKLDSMPTFESIVAFGQLILAEYELLQHSEPSEPRKPKVNKLQEGEEEPPPKGGKGKQGRGGFHSDHTSGGKGGSLLVAPARSIRSKTAPASVKIVRRIKHRRVLREKGGRLSPRQRSRQQRGTKLPLLYPLVRSKSTRIRRHCIRTFGGASWETVGAP